MKDPLTNLDYNSVTPIRTVQDESTEISVHQFSGDQVATEQRMSREERLAWRMKAASASKASRADKNIPPDFTAGEIAED